MPYEMTGNKLKIGIDTDDDVSVHFYTVLHVQVYDWLRWYCKKLELRGVTEIDFDDIVAVASESLNVVGYEGEIPDDLKAWITEYFEGDTE